MKREASGHLSFGVARKQDRLEPETDSWGELERGFFASAPPETAGPPLEPECFDDLDQAIPPRALRSTSVVASLRAGLALIRRHSGSALVRLRSGSARVGQWAVGAAARARSRLPPARDIRRALQRACQRLIGKIPAQALDRRVLSVALTVIRMAALHRPSRPTRRPVGSLTGPGASGGL